MTDPLLAARLRDLLSETVTRRVMAEVHARANADDSRHYDHASAEILVDLLYGCLLPLLSSLQEEREREIREIFERWLKQGYTDDGETPLDDYGLEVVREVLSRLASSSSPAAQEQK